ncbi:MAG: hypothetical protein WA952_08845 [Lewinella sp.]
MSIMSHAMSRRLLLAWVVGLSVLSARPASFVLTLVEIEQLSNDHVGDNWSHSARVDGWEVKVHESIDLASAEAYDIGCTSRESDPFYPDTGSRTLRMTEADMIAAANTGGFVVDVTVREGHGEYAGKQAVWRYHFALR